METNYIAHHGIKGQKWGVRRFQNPDGTLTKAGLRKVERRQKKLNRQIKRKEDYINEEKEHSNTVATKLSSLEKKGMDSNAWKEHVERQYDSLSDEFDYDEAIKKYNDANAFLGYKQNLKDDLRRSQENIAIAEKSLEKLKKTNVYEFKTTSQKIQDAKKAVIKYLRDSAKSHLDSDDPYNPADRDDKWDF